MFTDAPKNSLRRRGRFLFVFLIAQVVMLAGIALVSAADLFEPQLPVEEAAYQDALFDSSSDRNTV